MRFLVESGIEPLLGDGLPLQGAQPVRLRFKILEKEQGLAIIIGTLAQFGDDEGGPQRNEERRREDGPSRDTALALRPLSFFRAEPAIGLHHLLAPCVESLALRLLVILPSYRREERETLALAHARHSPNRTQRFGQKKAPLGGTRSRRWCGFGVLRKKIWCIKGSQTYKPSKKCLSKTEANATRKNARKVER